MIPLVEKFPKATFARAEVERERTLRLQILSAISSDITDDGDNWVLTTTFQSTQSLRSASTAIFSVDAGSVVTPGIAFGPLVPGGSFSSTPNDHSIARAIRTNNPGALNISTWQRDRKGFAGVTESDGSSNQNHTTIYRTPEHGVAAWFHLLNVIYGLGSRASFSLLDLAQRYSDQSSGSMVDGYVKGWSSASGGTIKPSTDLDLRVDTQALQLGRAMFFHEIGKASPLEDDQIAFGITHERNGTLPA